MVSFTVNGTPVTAPTEGDEALLFHLRNRLGLTAARFGCGQEQCGACIVQIDGQPRYACGTSVAALEGCAVTTPEALSGDPVGQALIQAFAAETAGQCGYCLAGILISAHALLSASPQPSQDQIIAALDRHLCRCGANGAILRAIRRAADTLAEATA
ncbi:2Fe-2S iron-sulfur cluster binding domain-containing protein [Paracoccus sp. M683]|nr:2Fe-2S iron-sulfur cluster binding domain-containing protein [Paracoccus sp. M683]